MLRTHLVIDELWGRGKAPPGASRLTSAKNVSVLVEPDQRGALHPGGFLRAGVGFGLPGDRIGVVRVGVAGVGGAAQRFKCRYRLGSVHT